MSEQTIRILHDKHFDLRRFRDTVRSFEDCAKVLSREAGNPVEKNVFLGDKMSVKVIQVAKFSVLFERNLVKVLPQPAL